MKESAGPPVDRRCGVCGKPARLVSCPEEAAKRAKKGRSGGAPGDAGPSKSRDVEIGVGVVLDVGGADVVEGDRVAMAEVDDGIAMRIGGDVGQQVLGRGDGQ